MNNTNRSNSTDCDINSPECYSPNTADPWETDYAALIPRFTGGLSAISSALIIYIILRSQTRLSTIYHRIMFGMSLADICGSIAMSLTSLPMPSYMPKEEIFGYHWTGTRLGNEYTCNAQGFFAMFGMGCMYNYNGMLCMYYACAIFFTMCERDIKKYVEPIIHGYPVVIGLLLAVPPLFYKMYNPGITAYPWCGPFPYPDECAVLDGVECIRGSAHMRDIIQVILPVTIALLSVIIVVPLVLVIYKVIQTDRLLDRISKVYRKHGNVEMNKVLEKHHNTKAVLIQASSYVSAFLVGAIPPFIISLGAIDSNTQRGRMVIALLSKLFIFLVPLQGFFNFIIFLAHKVYNYRHHKHHADVSVCRVLAILFCSSAHDPFFISRISFVKQYEAEKEEELLERRRRSFANDKKMLCSPPAAAQEQQQAAAVGHGRNCSYSFTLEDESNQELRQFRLGLMTKDSNSCFYGSRSSGYEQEEVDEEVY
jgi:hypothetical protein